MPKKKRYPHDFKLNAARLIIEGGYSYRKASDRLGVSVESLRSWVKLFRTSGELPAEEPPTTTRLRQLQHEVAELRIENEILKKAATYFAKESL
ncbi:MAG: transposase [Candidatus Fermentibacteraceae bacterium]|nr:transposase [Candidatus Fermentibacteraceae bacterium]